MKTENKTLPTDSNVVDFIASVPDETKRRDSETLIRLMQDITGAPAVMWGPSIVGFDSYHYKYESGREGDAPAAGFSPRKAALTVYLFYGAEKHTDLLSKLGPHTLSKSCLYIKRLSDIDMDVLKQLVKRSYNELRAYEKEHWS
jgi:hypothetical protein